MLSPEQGDRVSPLSIHQAISELVDVSGQTFFIMANGMGKDAIRRINLMRFHNAVAISKRSLFAVWRSAGKEISGKKSKDFLNVADKNW